MALSLDLALFSNLSDGTALEHYRPGNGSINVQDVPHAVTVSLPSAQDSYDAYESDHSLYSLDQCAAIGCGSYDTVSLRGVDDVGNKLLPLCNECMNKRFA